MTDEILADVRSEMASTIVSLKRDLARIRAGRASPNLLDGVMVDYYGVDTSLKQLATVGAPEARLLVIQPFDQGAVGSIEKAIRNANLGVSPMNDGKLIRVPIPELTEERRRDLVKQCGKQGESHRISLRSHRRDANDMLKQCHTDKDIGEDEFRSAQERVQKATNEFIGQVDLIIKEKEEDIMAV